MPSSANITCTAPAAAITIGMQSVHVAIAVGADQVTPSFDVASFTPSSDHTL